MKYGIVGNRQGWDERFVMNKIHALTHTNHGKITIVSGGADGIDYFAKQYAIEFKHDYQEFLPNKNEPSPQRYFNRNKKIAEECDVLIAFDMKIGASGTKNIIKHGKNFKNLLTYYKKHIIKNLLKM